MLPRRLFRQASPTELIYIATGTIVVSRCSIAGRVSRAQFGEALAHLERRFPILRAVVEEGCFVERADVRSAIEAWLPAHAHSADTLYAVLLNSGLDASSTLYSLHVIAADDRLDVFMLTSHAITDATSLVELHSCLAYLCDCVVRGVAPSLDEQPFPQPVDAAVDQILASLSEEAASPAFEDGPYAEIPMRADYTGPLAHHRLERIIIEPNDMHWISVVAHERGSSVHSLLLVAFARAIRGEAEGRQGQILMRSSVDMRRRLEPHISPDLVFTAITGHITPILDLDQPFFDIARHVFDDIHAGITNGHIFHDYVNYPRTFGDPRQPPVALNISNMQSVQFRWPLARLHVTGFEYALGWMKRYPNVSVTAYEGKLVANIVYAEEFCDPRVMRDIAEAVGRILFLAGRSSRRPAVAKAEPDPSRNEPGGG